MRKVVIAAFAIALMTVFSSAAQADEGQVSDNALAAIGLGDMQVMDDVEASEVRGQFALVAGGSYAVFNGFFGSSASANGYIAGGGTSAAGANFSTAGNFFGFGVFAGGFSAATSN